VTKFRRWDMKAILSDPIKRKQLMVDCIIATQAREGVITTKEQAEQAYDKVKEERQKRVGKTDELG
jgi:hypothetical protein